MKTFLEYVAADIIGKWGRDLARTAVVFPNKRAALFINDYLARLARKPLWSPKYITISELFRSQSNLIVGDPIKLVGDLHKSYVKVTGSDESLDHFYGYGQIMAADFDDIDKNLADAEKVFANVESLKEIDADTSYLSPEQKETLRRFFGACKDGDTQLKANFIKLWNNLHSIYTDYNKRLQSQGLAYEGMLYRRVVADGSADFSLDRYIFVGFNLLSRVEQALFDKINATGKAFFYWDYDTYYIDDNEAGRYIKTFKERYKNQLDGEAKDIYSHFTEHKNITFASASTEDLQARYITHWLNDDGGRRMKAGRKTAVVMCDEQLLTTAIHCLPDEARGVNITTGYPLSQMLYGPVAAMDGQLQKLLSRKITGGDADKWIDDITSSIERIAKEKPQTKKNPLIAETLFRTYKIVCRLKTLTGNGDIQVDTPTLKRLLREIVRTTSIPFSGEPAVGVQLMGMLETRNLDFDNVLILSCNEGNMPKGIGGTSFIPYSIRRAYGLTTSDHKVAIYSYYFHRLLQRAGDITIAYNTSTNNLARGEMSRYMLALLVEGRHKINRVALRAASQTDNSCDTPKPVEKSPRIMELLRKRFDLSMQQTKDDGQPQPLLAPTAINTYGKCQLMFYYRYVAGLTEPDNDENTIDPRTFGNIFHDAAMEIYAKMAEENNSLITRDAIRKTRDDKQYLKSVVDRAFRKNYFKTEENKKREYNGLQLINFNVILSYIDKLLAIDTQTTPFKIVGLEKDVMREITVDAGKDTKFNTTIGGRIDRMDSIETATEEGKGRRLRIIDYKTGANPIKKIPENIDDIFNGNGDHPDYYLQTLLYTDLARETLIGDDKTRTASPAIIFIQKAQTTDYDPTLIIGKHPIADESTIAADFNARLRERINEMFDPSKPFSPSDNCKHCPYLRLCR